MNFPTNQIETVYYTIQLLSKAIDLYHSFERAKLERKREREVTLRNGKQKGWIFTRKKIVSLWFGKYLELFVVWFLWKEKKKETPMSEKMWRFREKTSDFGQHWFYYPLFGNPISSENCLKNDLTIRPVLKRGKKIPPFALIKRRR